MALSERRRTLLASERWRDLAAFVERWYAKPLSDEDGNTQREVEEAERRIGTPLPIALGEWFELVGRRLELVQDDPQKLDEIRVENGSVCVWRENQTVWTIRSALGGDDPQTFAAGDWSSSPDAPLSRTLMGMLASDTLVGAWNSMAHDRIGPLGECGLEVRGGYCHTFDDSEVEKLHATYAPLDHVRCPHYEVPLHGDNNRILRISDVSIEWMTATDGAFQALQTVLALFPVGGEYEVCLAFRALTPAQLAMLGGRRTPTVDGATAVITAALGDVGHVGMVRHGDAPRFHVQTTSPDRVLEILLAVIPRELHSLIHIGSRPTRLSAYQTLYPRN